MICPNCSHQNRPNARFCEECGQPFDLRCPKCGESISAQARFCSSCGEKLDKPGAAGTAAPQDRLAAIRSQAPKLLQEKMRLAKGGMQGERKPVTILFTDIVGSTSLADKLDPEEWQKIVSGAHQCVSQAVYRYEGTIAQLLGDGVLAFFGAPITHEDDPLRSVQAAVDIQDAVRAYATTLPASIPDFKLRVGINTGTVVVGNIGDDLHMEYLAIGDTVNLAARLQSLAEPGGIVLSQETARCVEQTVELQDLGEVAVKGKQEPVRIYKVTRLKEVHGHGRRRTETGKNQLVGRQTEMTALLNAAGAVQAGLGRVVVLIGEPGLGKTRLINELKKQLGGRLQWSTGECLSYGQELPYHLLSAWLHNLLKLPENASERETGEALGKLTKALFGGDAGENYAFLGHLLSISMPEEVSQFMQGLNPQGFQAQYLASIRRVLLAMTRSQPLALIFEDIHWADPSSVAILTKLVPLAKEAPLLFCFVSRPEPGTPGWGLIEACRAAIGGGLVEINLQSLAEAEVQQLAVNLLDGVRLPESVQSLVNERAEGNPLFVEELISLLVEKDLLVREKGGLQANRDLKTISLPENLMRLMLARIDRLPEDPKRTLRVASVIGRQFGLTTLKDVLQRIGQSETRPRLLGQLTELETASLVQLTAVHPEIIYLFRHALIQEAAYEAVLKSDRRWMHRAAAEAIESAYPDRLDELAPTLAYHFERGEERQKALHYLEKAGDRANQTYANREAIALYQAAVEQADILFRDHQTDIDPLQGVKLRIKLGNIQARVGQHEAARSTFMQALESLPEDQPLWRARIYDSIGNAWIIPREYVEAIKAYRLAEQALGGMPDENQTEMFTLWLEVQMDVISGYYWMNDVHNMEKLIDRLGPVIERTGTPAQRSTYYSRISTMELRRDRYWPDDLTLHHIQLAISATQESNDLDTFCQRKFGLGFCHLWRMELDQAEACLTESLSIAERIGNMEARLLSSSYLTVIYRKKNEIGTVKIWANRCLPLAREANISFYLGMALGNLAWASYMEGDLAQAEEYTRQAHETGLNLPTIPMRVITLWPLLGIHLEKGDLAQAVETAQEIIHPSQIRMPDELEAVLSSGIDFYKEGKVEPARERLESAVKLAVETGYF